MAAETQSHIQYWKSFDIIALQRDLDAAANDLAARQDESENSRKKLIEQSREFKKATSEDIRKAVAPLLKGFQAEVDALSRRSKAAEAAFLGVYKKLIDVPNPVPVLEQALIHHRSAQKLSDYEIENQKLRETLAEYNSEFAEVKNQELTIKQLRDKIKEYELKIEAEVQSRILSQEKELSRQFQEREKQLHETQLSYAKKLGLAEQQMNVLKAALEASQSELFELKAKLEESATAKSDEMDLLMADLERANERASIAEKHSENLRDQVDKLQSSIKAEERSLDNLKKSQLEMELASKEREVTQLVEEVQKLQSGMAKLHHEYSVRLSRLEDDLGNKDLLLNKLNDRLAKQVDYDEISKELKILKSIEFSSIRGDGTDEEKSKPLETLLLEKNKTLQTENTKLKNANNDLAVERVKKEPPDNPSSPSSRTSDTSSMSHIQTDVRVGSPSMWSTPNVLYSNSDLLKESLDTLEISNRVKEILSMHNIGQRVFARQVLGLSQGTVSELLSKPKHWDKLTEKGRESYRKMYYWLRDIRNIDALKTLSPRKPPGPFPVSKHENVNTEERIVQILKEAQNDMCNKSTDNVIHSTSNAVNHSVTRDTNTPVQSEKERARKRNSSATLHSSTHVTNQESSEAIVSRIYEEELGKLAIQAKQSGNIAEYQLYQAELERIQCKKLTHSLSQDEMHDLQAEPEDLSRSSTKPCDLILSDHNHSSLSRGESPLQQMQNITNQFLSNSQAHLLQQKPLKHVLPPISQEQFDKYTGLNTEDLVKKVKELLSQFSISQRLFGENVLGLSQGSVSDLLARPKPWSMLTQKGREPFIRMKIFLEDPEAVKRLMSNQYKANLAAAEMGSRDTPSLSAADTPERCISTDTTVLDNWMPTMVPTSFSNNLMHAPSIIEIVAATGELDTLFVTSRVKEMLQFHNIGQKLFGEAVLGLSQGSVSDMLSKPKPWHLLSLKGREPFVRMHLWLSDPMNVFRLKTYQAEVKAFRRRSGSCGTAPEEDRASPYYIKKPRYAFTEDQKNVLRQAFQNDPYPTSAAIEKLAYNMDLSSKTVINWFHNHRMRSKQQNRDENGRRINGLYIKQEADSNSIDSSQFHSHNSYTTESQKSSPGSDSPSPDSTNPSPPQAAVERTQATSSNNTSRKRKNAHPKYVSAGAVLDKYNDSEGEETELEIDVTGGLDSQPSIDKSKIAKLEQRLTEDDDRWEDDDNMVDREKCLQKLETHVKTLTAEDWAF